MKRRSISASAGMSTPSSTAFPFAPAREAIRLDGIAFVALTVHDAERAATFYRDVLGFVAEHGAQLPHAGDHAIVRTASGQRIVLCASGDVPLPPDMGRHTAFGVTPDEREAIVRRLQAKGVEVQRYQEDRPAECDGNWYFLDPDGNRIQLVSAPGGSIDHVAITAIDIEWEEDLYVGALALPVDYVAGWRTEDYKRAVLWGEGQEAMAPGTRRWDKRFAMRPGQGPMIARPNMQLFVRAGRNVLGVFLAYEHYQLPLEEQIVGTPRIGFATSASELDAIAARFAEAKLPVDGPHDHPSTSPYRASLYAKDRGGNFLEFTVAR
jgi:catechol 2,3-dioxygenase-like lactoylglutathione lyase family enzyme